MEAEEAVTKILISGASGFVGSNLAPKLREEGYDVCELLRVTSQNTALFTDNQKIVGDLLDYSRIEKVVEEIQPEIIVHLAALTPVRFSWLQPFLYELTNFNGTYNLIESAKKHLKKFTFVFASTAEVYGKQPADKPLKEDAVLHPISPYAGSKVKAESLVTQLGDFLILRINNTFGRPHSGYFVESMMEQMLPEYMGGMKITRREPVKVNLYNARHKRDYLFIDNHVNAYLHLITGDKTGVFNVAQGSPISNVGMVMLMANILGVDVEISERTPDFPRLEDQTNIWQDLTKIHQTGWCPKVTREEGIRRLRAMYNQS